MKHLLFAVSLLLAAVSSLSAQPSAGYPHFPVRDLALIYAGDDAIRPQWTSEQLRPYIAHTYADGSADWLFDGFLFLEFRYTSPVDGYVDFRPVANSKPARREHYEHYLNTIFGEGRGLSALDREISRLKEQIGDPGFRHKIILTLFMPRDGQTDWGEVDGKQLDFNNFDDKLTAVEWLLGQLVERFDQAGYQNLDLIGMYWIHEELRDLDGIFTKAVSQKVHRHGLKFCWIPWFKAPGSERWREYGFDMVYQQPNYGVWPKAPQSQLNEACLMAREHNMGLEFETSTRALSSVQDDDSISTEYAKRFNRYLDVFAVEGVKTHAPIAYYTDTKFLLQVSQNPVKRDVKLVDRLARFISERRKYKRLDP